MSHHQLRVDGTVKASSDSHWGLTATYSQWLGEPGLKNRCDSKIKVTKMFAALARSTQKPTLARQSIHRNSYTYIPRRPKRCRRRCRKKAVMKHDTTLTGRFRRNSADLGTESGHFIISLS